MDKMHSKRARKRFATFGPGIITGGAGDDPAGIATYTIIGSTTGFSLLWLMLLSTPMMIAVQDTVSRIAIATKKSLPEITNTFYSKKFTIFMVSMLSIANIFTIAADMEAVAVILEILTGIESIYFLVPVTALIAYLVMFGKYKTVKRVLIFLTTILLVYMASAILAKPDILLLLHSTFIPHISTSSAFILAALGLLGTTISPYMLFWQATEEKEEQQTVVQVKEVNKDTAIGMIYSNAIAYCIIVSAAMILFTYGVVPSTIKDISLSLKPIAGEYAFLLFSMGIIVSGFLAVPVLSGSSAYAIADTFGWREGLDNKVSDAKGFYLVFIGSLLLGDLIDLSSISAVDALYYTQILDGVLLPVLIGIILLLSNNSKIMGKYINTKFNNIFCISTLILSTALTFIMLYQMFY
jgi:Mn2+/Fe2+ NRAMP family transporter